MLAAIIQARTGSTRLPNKVLKKVAGKALLEHLILRMQRCRSIRKIIVATTDRPQDRKIVRLAEKLKVEAYQGSQEDVLDRYYQAACEYGVDDIVRITGDCPVIDPGIVDRVVNFYKKNKRELDYVSNTLPPTYPDGMDVEVFSFSVLERAWKEAKLPSEREHVTSYIRNRAGYFKIDNVSCRKNFSHIRLTVDEEPDVVFIRRIFSELGAKNPFFNLRDILALLAKKENFQKINSAIGRNEGYLLSLERDRRFGNTAKT